MNLKRTSIISANVLFMIACVIFSSASRLLATVF